MKLFLYALLAAGLIGTAWAAPKEDNAVQQKENLQGEWKSLITQGYGKDAPDEERKTIYLTFKGDQLLAKYGEKTAEATYKLILTKAGPSQVDVTVTQGTDSVKGKTFKGIYLLEGNTLKISYRDSGKPRPSTFTDEDEAGVYTISFKKAKQ